MNQIFTRLILFTLIVYPTHFLKAQKQAEGVPAGKVLASLARENQPGAALAGSYTIGGENPDFASFSAAVAALEAQGISGAVNFIVRPGTYTEQLELNNIPGSSCNIPIVFEGEGVAPAEVFLQSPADSITTITVNGIDGLTFRNMGLARNIVVQPGSDCFALADNVILGSVHSTSSAAYRNNQHRYSNNLFQRGGITVANQAPWNPAAPVFDEGLLIEGNEFRNGGIISVEGQEGFTISNNEMASGAGITVENSWYGQEINGNTLSNIGGAAIRLQSGAAASISGNYISYQDGGIGMEISTGKSLSDEMLIANNFVYGYGYDARGIYYFPIDNLVGLELINTQVGEVKIYHNTIRIAGYSVDVPNYALSVAGESNSFYIMNNVLSNSAWGSAIVVNDPDAIAALDYNNYVNMVGLWSGQEILSLADWQTVTGFDAHSIEVDPGGERNPAEAMAGAGTTLEEVAQDYYGQERGNPPTIGAVESELPAIPALSGVYTIGGNNPDYNTFGEAISALEHSGVEDSVVFKIRPGNYYEQLNISATPTEGTKIIFEGESGDSTEVVLHYPLDEVLYIRNSGNLSFHHLTFASGIEMSNSSNLLFTSNVISGGVTASMVSRDAYRNNLFLERGIVERGEGHQQQGGQHFFETDNSLAIKNNTFEVYGTAISLYAQADISIRGNSITIKKEGEASNGVTAIRISDSEDINSVSQNIIVSAVPSTTAMSFSGGFFSGALPRELTHNKINLNEGGTGLFFEYYGGSTGPSLVANNIISINGKEGSTGVAISYSPGDFNFFNNSFYLYGNDNSSRVFYFGDEIFHEIKLTNNILANNAGGKVFVGEYFGYSPDKIATSDYNNLYTNGDTLALWEGGPVYSLNEWQAQTGFDTHSISVDPEFESMDYLVPANPALDGAGIALEAVTTDYFGELRNDPPDLGAVEFTGEGEEPQLPLPTGGLVVGGGVFHSPAGAIKNDLQAEGRAILSFHADQNKKDDSPRGLASLTIPQAGFRFQSVNAWEWMAINDNTAVLQGTGELNGEAGYHFIISAADLGSSLRGPRDTYRMLIWGPEGELVYDNQAGLEKYAIATMAIERGGIMIRPEAIPNARLSEKEATAERAGFKAWPTKLDQEELWLEVSSDAAPEQLQLSILDSQGRLVAKRSLSSSAGKQNWKLPSGNWAPGVYLLIVEGTGYRFQQKLVK